MAYSCSCGKTFAKKDLALHMKRCNHSIEKRCRNTENKQKHAQIAQATTTALAEPSTSTHVLEESSLLISETVEDEQCCEKDSVSGLGSVDNQVPIINNYPELSFLNEQDDSFFEQETMELDTMPLPADKLFLQDCSYSILPQAAAISLMKKESRND